MHGASGPRAFLFLPMIFVRLGLVCYASPTRKALVLSLHFQILEFRPQLQDHLFQETFCKLSCQRTPSSLRTHGTLQHVI